MSLDDIMRRDLADAEREERDLYRRINRPACTVQAERPSERQGAVQAEKGGGSVAVLDLSLGFIIGFGAAVVVWIVGSLIANLAIN